MQDYKYTEQINKILEELLTRDNLDLVYRHDGYNIIEIKILDFNIELIDIFRWSNPKVKIVISKENMIDYEYEIEGTWLFNAFYQKLSDNILPKNSPPLPNAGLKFIEEYNNTHE